MDPAHFLGCLHCLWHSALEQQEDGDLTRWPDAFTAHAASFKGDPAAWVEALRTAGWLDGSVLHDWLDYAGRFLESKYRSSDPDRLIRIWALHGREFTKVPGKLMSAGWSKVRKAAIERDGNKCLKCGDTDRLEVHHKIPLSAGGGDELSNLETLCKRCHSMVPKNRSGISQAEDGPPNPPTKPTRPNQLPQTEGGIIEKGLTTAAEMVEDFHKRAGTTVSPKEAREQDRLLNLRMPFGEFKGTHISSLPADRARWLLTEWNGRFRLGAELKKALELCVHIKEMETNR